MSDAASSPIHVSSFSEEERAELLAQQPSTSSVVRDDSHGQPNAEESPLQQVSEIPGSPRRPDELNAQPQQSPAKKQRITAYALDMESLPHDLKEFLQAVRQYFTQSVNLEREKAAVSMSTFSKCQERMLCFLGYCKTTLGSEETLNADCFLRTRLIEGYVEFLREVRKCSSATMSNHLSALIYAAKFLHRNAAPDYKDVAIIRRLRSQARILQKEGDNERPQTKEDLQAQNRWLPWEEIVTAVRTQREKFELTVPAKPKARECADLLLLSIYVFIPPSRGLEIRTLEIVGEEESLEARKDTARNLLIQMASGDIRLHFSNFKTRKFVGRDELPLGREDELCRLMNVYIKDHRPKLVTASSQRYLLLGSDIL
ncbi:uncharacterized protein LOC114964302 [Acropora millepora]|uniref:uncharacterized protein LOC114964302 n=1 Tax=Acropora millepora TaxID=45264 RepID=UPI001CF3AA5E|nr:uncharacterized protein LOC114964302 [Acropora millepora]